MRRTRIGVGAVTLLVLLAGGVNIGLAAVSVLQPTDDTCIDTRTPDTVFNDDPFDKFLYADYSYIGPHARLSTPANHHRCTPPRSTGSSPAQGL